MTDADRDPRQLTLLEATALQLAALAALDDVRAELGPATMRELRAAATKLNDAIEVLAGHATRMPPGMRRAVATVRATARVATTPAAPVPRPRKLPAHKASKQGDEGKRRRRPPQPNPRRTVVDRKRHTREQ
jgi:hypothetical protein